MAKRFVILCSIQRLAYQDKVAVGTEPAYYAFGLNLTAAIGVTSDDCNPVTAEEALALRPWMWSAIRQVQASTNDGAKVFTCNVLPLPATIPDVDLITLTQRLNNDEYNPANEPDLRGVTTWALPDSNPVTRNVPLDFAGGRRQRWHASILQLSTYPFPIPQRLNLSFVVKVPKDQITDPDAPLFLAPIIPDSTFFTATTTPTGALLATGDNARNVFRWNYDNGTQTQLEVAAYLVPARVNEPPLASETLIDLSTGWIRNAAHFEDEWRAYLERRAGEVFDLADRLIDYVRDHVADLRTEHRALTFLEDVIVCVTRDLAGTGLLPSISMKTERRVAAGGTILDGNTLADDLLGPNPQNKLTREELELLRRIERTLFDDKVKWKRFLVANLPQVAGLKILRTPVVPTTVPEPPQPIEDSLGELEQLHKALLDPNNLHAIVQKQWEQIFQKAGSLGPRLQALKQKIISLKPEFDYRSRLAQRNLGPVWNALREASRAGRACNLDVKNLLGELLINHLEARLHLDQTQEPRVNQDEYDGFLPPFDARSGQPTLACEPGCALTTVISCVIADLQNPIGDPPTTKLKRLLENVAPSAGTLDKATPVPHSISLQAHLSTMRPDSSAPLDDVLHQISGVLVLLREQPDPRWYCLNYACANVRDAMENHTRNLVTVPARINYQNDLSQSLITYNNVPLVARSPLAGISQVEGNATVAPGDQSQANAAALVRYDYSTHDHARIKALVFGNSNQLYDASMCVVRNSGVLPKEISKDDSPWEIDPAKLRTLDLSGNPQYVKSFSYQRKVRVGQIRNNSNLKGGEDDTTKANQNLLRLPIIPPQVFPRAVHLPPVTGAPGSPPRLLSEELPLLVLAPDQGWGLRAAFDFSLRKPATDIETWHRWVNDRNTSPTPPCTENSRVGVLSDYYATLDNNRRLPKNKSAFDVSIDDPAVTDFLVELLRFDPATNDWSPVARQQVPRPVNRTPCQLTDVQSKPLDVVCVSRDREGLQLSGDLLQVSCLEGQIYWLKVHATVENTALPRFASVVSREFQNDGDANPRLTSAFELLIEVATARLPSKTQLWESIKPRFKSDSDAPAGLGDRIEVSLESAVPEFLNVYSAELQRQSWYWQGRETREFPARTSSPFNFIDPDLLNPDAAASGPGLSERMRLWEEFEFAARDGLDFNTVDFKRSVEEGNRPVLNVTAPVTWFTYTEQLTPATASTGNAGNDRVRSDQRVLTANRIETGTEQKGDLRSKYYRFSASAVSRYAGMFPQGLSATVSARSPQAISDDLAKWRRLFVPCRRKDQPPVPKIKLILPLTESYLDHDATRSPGLLVVLDEQWYEFAGLGEGLTAEVELLADPHNPPPNDPQFPDPCPFPGSGGTKFHYELGPDPILTMSRALFPQADSNAGARLSSATFGRIRGPVGHTHDERDIGALFTATSFVVPAPKIQNRAGGQTTTVNDLSWYMCKVRVRRQVRLRGAASTDAAAVMRSDATEPQWVQYLPEFSLFADSMQVKELHLVFVDDDTVEIRRNSNDQPVSPGQFFGPAESGSLLFTPVLLITRTVFDAAGESNNEAYVGFCWPDGNSSFSFLRETQQEPISVAGLRNRPEIHFKARVLIVQGVPVVPEQGAPQRMAKPASAKDFCDLLFAYTVEDIGSKPQLSDEKRPRIVRLSQPIGDTRS